MAARCPQCGAPVPADSPARPFCSSRCRLVDLGRWLSEEYRVPVDEENAGPGAPAPGAPAAPDRGAPRVPE